MDLWSRLIGSGSTTPTKTLAPPSPEQRLARFKREYSQALIWNKVLIKTPKPTTVITIQLGLNRLALLLRNDALAPAPHLCVTYAASTYVYKAVSRVSLILRHDGVFREAVALFARFVDSDADAVLGARKFAETLMTFAEQVLEPSDFVIDMATEEGILELLFNVVTKLRIQPELIQAWFRPDTDITLNRDLIVSETLFEAPLESKTFPLCRLLIGRAHRDGKTGDFARTGMLYIFDCATHSPQLEEWLIESELPTLMASGLGALYSHLSRKVTIAHPEENQPLVLALAEGHRLVPNSEAESVYSLEFQSRLSTFLQHLIFWQDVLDHCTSTKIKVTLEEHFHSLFLRQILYPSLLQSSDVDGGSSVAVLTYCWKVLEALHHPDLIYLFLNYLLALRDSSAQKVPDVDPCIDTKLSSLHPPSALSDQLEPSFFSLVDLLLASIQSLNSETVTAALRVITIILQQHHRYAISSLFRVSFSKSKKSKRTFGALNLELETLLSLARDIGGEEGMDDAYKDSLKDAQGMIESHVCSYKVLNNYKLSPMDGINDGKKPQNSEYSQVKSHSLNTDDPLMRSLATLFRTFFTNDIEVNLGLTGVLAHLASCPYVRLDGWLVVDPAQYVKVGRRVRKTQSKNATSSATNIINELDLSEQTRVDGFTTARLAPSWLVQSEPLILKILRQLKKQLDAVKPDSPEFDSLVASRKRAFEGAAELEEELAEAAHQKALMTLDSPGNVPSTPPRKPTVEVTNMSQRGRTVAATRDQFRTPTTSPRPSETYSRSWLTSSPLSLLSPQPPETPRRSKVAIRTGSPVPRRQVTPPEETASPAIQAVSSLSEHKVVFKFSKAIDDEAQISNSDNESMAKKREASLDHVVTNVVILQQFTMEMAAIIQMRSGMFDGELKFD